MINRKQAIEMLKVAEVALHNNGDPCIYQYCNHVDISRGDYMGIAEPVRNHAARIVLDSEELRDLLNPYMCDFKSAVDAVIEVCNGEDI
jgi:hypothetical protein